MLAISPFTSTSTSKDEIQGHMESFNHEDFTDFSDGHILESIDFDDLFAGIEDGDVLPGLEMDPEILAEFLIPGKEEEDKVSGCGSGLGSSCLSSKSGEEIASKSDESHNHKNISKGHKEGDKGRKSTTQGKHNSNNNNSSNNNNNNNIQGKRKMKVDWTPELHRRFVQAVEQLGVDKAVPSRILELMGNDSLTRHNIASHLQKYRSQRKHLLAREAEAASWSQKRQVYGSAAAGGGGANKRNTSLWQAPTMGFPPMHPHHHFRPLHVWGHPWLNQSMMHMWPKHLAPRSPSPSPPPPPAAAPAWPAPPPPNPSFWHPHHQRVPNGLTPGTPCFPQPPVPMRFGTPPVPAVPPHAIYNVEPSGMGIPVRPPPAAPQSLLDFQPSKESVDAAIGDVLSKPWLPLPIGLKPPSTDSVLVELQRHGVSDIPPTCP